MNPFVTFIIPSIARKTLANTIMSLYEQEDPDWSALVVFDNVEPVFETTFSNRILGVKTPLKLGVGVNGAGKVRDYGITLLKQDFDYQGWIGLVDDDDRLTTNYVRDLKNISSKNPNADIIVFSMKYADGTILPPINKIDRKSLVDVKTLENAVGISYAFKTHVYFEAVKFEPSSGEDYSFLLRAQNAGYNIVFTTLIGYMVSPLGCAEDRKPK
jgi:hypothetical protein